MIREQIKKDLKRAIEKSGALRGNFLDNIEWLLQNVNRENFEDFSEPLPVGKMRPEIQKVIGAEDDLVYLKPRVYAKIRGWWEVLPGYPELGNNFYYLLPLALYFPTRILADKNYEDTFLLVTEYERGWVIVVEVIGEESRWEIKTMFLIDSRRLDKEYETVWQTKKEAPLGGLADPSVLAPATVLQSKSGRVAGARFPSLQESSVLDISTLKERCQVDVLEYSKAPTVGEIHLEHPANPEHGDYSTNIAMKLAKKVGKPPTEVADDVMASLRSLHSPSTKGAQFTRPLRVAKRVGRVARQKERELKFANTIERVEVAGPGFINFYLKKEWLQEQVGEILEEGGDYGLVDAVVKSEALDKVGKEMIQVEFISANPTGPLHAGNARGGFGGDVLASVLSKVGYDVQREYYINDKGGQVDKLAESVKAYRDAVVKSEALDKVDIPADGYRGEYVEKIAHLIHDREKNGQKFETFESLKTFAVSEILKDIKKTIARMGIKFDQFFSESSLYDSSQAQKAIDFLKSQNLTYEKEGAVWFRSSKFGDEKDRVLIKSDGEMTYLVSDLAYHLNKFEKRKFDKVILFWGADHHGYIPRFMAMMEAIGHKGQAEVELIQLLKLARGGKEVRMSKRAGEYITVDDVLDEIGLDAARFHFLAVPLNTPMTLDLERAAEQSQKNPVYYVQYACARMHSILAKSEIRNPKFETNFKFECSKLETDEELALIRKLIQLPEVVVDISENHEIHRLPQYAIEVADAFHRFYENCRVLSDDGDLTMARLGLVKATRIILAETLGLMGISAPNRM